MATDTATPEIHSRRKNADKKLIAITTIARRSRLRPWSPYASGYRRCLLYAATRFESDLAGADKSGCGSIEVIHD